MLEWLKERLTFKAKVIIAVLVLVIAVGGGVIAYKFYDFTQNNPKFCVACHLMQPAYDAWAESEHKSINCHDCHHLSIPEQNQLLISFVFKRPTSVPPRHGKVIVGWKYCVSCHWEQSEKYPNAPKINDSSMHAKHYFSEQIECSKCHGYIVHEFTPEARFCVKCHENKEVHGKGMEGLACLNCHTEKSSTLRPERANCLYCHGTEKSGEKSATEERYLPKPETVQKAIKIKIAKDSPMKFDCYKCHKPHDKARPDWANCLDCHKRIPDVGKHSMHIKTMGMSCKDCHKPHLWTVTKEAAKTLCTTCHEYRDPITFIKK